MRTTVCPGSFDPITKGHIDIIERAAALFDTVIVLVSNNPDKKYTFSLEERIEFVTIAAKKYPNVEIDVLTGLLADYVREKNICAVVRGLRAVSDFEYEFQMALTNKALNPGHETIFFSAGLNSTYLSSSLVKQIAGLGGDISSLVPIEILDKVNQKFK